MCSLIKNFIILSIHQVEDKEFWTQDFQRGKTQEEYNLRYYEELLQHARLGVSHRDWHVYAKNQIRGVNRETALQIHRFYVGMRYGEAIYGVKLTVREKRNGDTVFYTLEAHDLNIQEITPDTEASGGGVVKPALPAETPVIQFNAFFEKFKPIVDLLGLKYKEMYPDVLFSESGQAEELANLMAKRVAPIIRDASGRDSDVREEVRTLLSQEGFDLSDAELEEIIKRAQQQVRRFRSLQRLTEENDYIRATDQWIATLQDVYSTNFKISTAGKYATEDFSGTWIGKDGGVAPDEAARTLSAAFGQEITDDDVVDHFRDLKRRDLLARRREENRAMEEALREEERLHDMELAEQILAGEFPFDDEFIGSNPRVAKMVRDMVSPAKPGEPRADWATVRAALGTTDIRTLQEIATREVRRVLPEELQGAFLKRIAELGKFRPFMRTGNCGSPPTPGPDRAA